MDATEFPFAANEMIFDAALLDSVMLQRSGEALELIKAPDRFSLSLTAGHALTEVAGLAALPTRLIGAGLVEIQTVPEQLELLMQVARSAEAIAFASHIYEMVQSPGTLVYLTDQLMLQFAEWVTAEQMHQIATAAGLQILKLVASVPKAFVFQMMPTATANPLKLAERLLQQPEVVLAEPNIAVMRQPCYRPRESDYSQQWYLHHEGGEALAPGSHIFAEAAWNLTRGSRSIGVAIVDDGIDLNHPDFQSEGKIVAPLNLAPSPSTAATSVAIDAVRAVLPLPAPDQHHGTELARLIAADETGKGMIGVAPGCALLPIRIGEFIDDQTIEQFCQWVIDKGADVVCCGWSAAAVYYPLSLRQRVALTQAATQGRDGRGCVLLFAAGNANRPLHGIVPEQDSADGHLQGATAWLNGFAVHPDVISVAACTSLNQKAAYSNWGAGISIAAPAGQAAPVLETQQYGVTATAPLLAQLSTARPMKLSQVEPASDADMPLGTSAACGLAAGVAALILSINPDLTAAEVRQTLEQSADKIIDLQPDPQLGLSLPGYIDRHSAWFGYGKINAIQALQLAQRQAQPFRLPTRWLQYACSIQSTIPDGDPQGLLSPLQIDKSDPIRDIEVIVEIEHEFLGDLELHLIPPWGSSIPLQSRSGGRQTSLKTTYSLDNAIWLKTALNRPAHGQWQLQIIDAVPEKRGVLQKWQLNLGL